MKNISKFNKEVPRKDRVIIPIDGDDDAYCWCYFLPPPSPPASPLTPAGAPPRSGLRYYYSMALNVLIELRMKEGIND